MDIPTAYIHSLYLSVPRRINSVIRLEGHLTTYEGKAVAVTFVWLIMCHYNYVIETKQKSKTAVVSLIFFAPDCTISSA